jgi:hypothetical protein
VINVRTPILNGIPREYVADVTYANVIRTAKIVGYCFYSEQYCLGMLSYHAAMKGSCYIPMVFCRYTNHD